MTTAPRPGAHLSAVRTAPDQLRADVEPLLGDLDALPNDLPSLEQLAAIAERAHEILGDALSRQEVR